MAEHAHAQAHGGGCESCAVLHAANLRKLGVDVAGADRVVALAGNPNTGKSTVFNALTGLRQHVGNWAGKTVSRAEGAFRFDGHVYRLVDLPGAYSLHATSVDEEIARDFLLFGQPDVVVVVTDATRLDRNLALCLQVLEVTGRVVVALNLVDEARRHGVEVDHRQLARDLGVPVVPMVARRGEGVPELLEAVAVEAGAPVARPPRAIPLADTTLERAVADVARELDAAFPGLPNARWVALRLLDGDPSVERAVADGSLGDLARGAPTHHNPLHVTGTTLG